MARNPPNGGVGWGWQRDPQWVAYDKAYAQYEADLKAWEKSIPDGSATVTAVVNAQKKANTAYSVIESAFTKRNSSGGLKVFVKAVLDNRGSIINVDGERIIQSRFYIVTYVTDWGEESAPSGVSSMVEVDQYSSVQVDIPAPPANRNITKWRLYRSNTGSAVSAFQFVAEGDIATRTYLDSQRGEDLGEVCPTTTWLEPPFRRDPAGAAKGTAPYLRGAVGMPNGIVAGFIDNFVAFCEPYHHYAWPVEYQITTEHPIVGLGVFGQSLFVGTMGRPYIMSGADSANISAQQLPADQACVSRRSICGVGNGVIYASPDGLCLATVSGVELLTGELWAREDWQKLNPHEIVAAVHEGVYYFWTANVSFALDFASRRLGRLDVWPTAVFIDALTDHLYAAVGARVMQLFGDKGPYKRNAQWASGPAQLPSPTPLAWMQVDADYGLAENPVTVRWFGDGELRHEAHFTDLAPQRLPPGRYMEHRVEVDTSLRVTKVMLAGDTSELKSA